MSYDSISARDTALLPCDFAQHLAFVGIESAALGDCYIATVGVVPGLGHASVDGDCGMGGNWMSVDELPMDYKQ